MKLKITLEGKVYEVDVDVAEPENGTHRYSGAKSSHSIPTGGTPAPAAPVGASDGKSCRSPLNGVVSEVHVKVGDVVELDQTLLVLEAMKMFTTVTSAVAGKITSTPVAPGDSVKQGQALVEFE